MKRKTILISIAIFLLIVATGIFVYLYWQNRTQQNNKAPITSDNFTLTYSYVGENSWQYTVTGEAPTSCYNITTDAVVMESYPEQVQIQVTVVDQSPYRMCPTEIQKYSYTGSFSASSRAIVSLVVK